MVKCIDCNKNAIYNVEGLKTGIYCVTHKKYGMCDVVHKTCIECKKRPYYNIEGETNGIYCSDHKKQGMVDVINKRCIDCNKVAIYNMEGLKPSYCREHKKQGMVDVINKRCKTHLCDIQVNNIKYEGFCLRCYIHTFPDKPVARNYKTKEQNTVDKIKSHFPDLNLIEDNIISGGCTRRRPDLFLDVGHQIIITEIDENRHTDYECSCENKRLMEISQDVGHRPIVFIRFNPDGYTDVNGKKITSCFKTNKNGIMTVPKSKINEWNDRIVALTNQIQYWIENTTDKMVEIVQLYY
jgi:EsV-1-7 cysteine-rich motif